MFRALAVIFSLISIASAYAVAPLDTSSQLIISVRDQKLMLMRDGGKVRDLSSIHIHVRFGRCAGANDYSSG